MQSYRGLTPITVMAHSQTRGCRNRISCKCKKNVPFLYNPNDLPEVLIFYEFGVNKPSKEIKVKLLAMNMSFFTRSGKGGLIPDSTRDLHLYRPLL